MPYRTSYLLQQAARGRPIPHGSPDPHLYRAIENLSPPDIETAIRQGAQVNGRDPRGRSALHALFDRAILPDGRLGVPMDRLIYCCRALLRENADVSMQHPATGENVLYRTAALAAHPQAAAWFHFWKTMRRGNFLAPGGRDLPSPLAAWHEKAGDAMRERLPPLIKPTPASDGPVTPEAPRRRQP